MSWLVKLTVMLVSAGTEIEARSKARFLALTEIVTGLEGAGDDVGWGAWGCVATAGGCVGCRTGGSGRCGLGLRL